MRDDPDTAAQLRRLEERNLRLRVALRQIREAMGSYADFPGAYQAMRTADTVLAAERALREGVASAQG